jgi:hypothetical protein
VPPGGRSGRPAGRARAGAPLGRRPGRGAAAGRLARLRAHLAGERTASIDVYLAHGDGNLSAKARGLMFALVQRFQPEWTEQRSLDRGEGDE